uniref:Uncharacterized protein n=1 Tax=Thermosporothrix sp. COM3 TaxID=2490863 RepID=A0A455SGQ6_9CHLR|nr:hypothetical protein KTC_16770 [Thermosporothrix sp. COM3]
MPDQEKPNPFCVLRLPTGSTLAEIVARGEDLHQIAENKEQAMLIHWATEQLKSNPETRLEYELFELPDTRYENEEWENFARKQRRKPITLAALAKESQPTPTQQVNMPVLLQSLLKLAQKVEKADIESVLDHAPCVPECTTPAMEEWNVISELIS